MEHKNLLNNKLNPACAVLVIVFLIGVLYMHQEVKKQGTFNCAYKCIIARNEIRGITAEQDPFWQKRAASFCRADCQYLAPCVATFKNGNKAIIDDSTCGIFVDYMQSESGEGKIRITRQICTTGGGIVTDKLYNCVLTCCKTLQDTPNLTIDLIKESEFCQPTKFDLNDTNQIICPSDPLRIRDFCNSSDTCYCPQLMAGYNMSGIAEPKECIVNLTGISNFVVNCPVCGC